MHSILNWKSASLVAVFACASASASPYTLFNKSNGAAMENFSNTGDYYTYQNTYNASTGQKWTVIKPSPLACSVRLKPVSASGKSLTIQNGSHSAGAFIFQTTDVADNIHTWDIFPITFVAGIQWYAIVNHDTAFCLSSSGSAFPPVWLTQQDCGMFPNTVLWRVYDTATGTNVGYCPF